MNQPENEFPQLEIDEDHSLLNRKLKHNARAIKWSRRARWTSRVVFLMSGAIFFCGMFWHKELPFLAGLVFPAIILFFLSAIALFLTGGLVPAFVHPILSNEDKKTLGD